MKPALKKPALIYDPFNPQRLLTPEEAKAAKRARQRSTDPEFAAKRVRWLQQYHKQPLADRCWDVLNDRAKVILPQLMSLPDKTARYILRAAVKAVPDEDYRRRWRYVATCIESENPRDEDLVAKKGQSYHFADLQKRLGAQHEKLAERLWKAAMKRGPEWLGNVCRLALDGNVKHPARYVRTVLDNATRKPSAKRRGGKRFDMARSEQRERIIDGGIPDPDSPD